MLIVVYFCFIFIFSYNLIKVGIVLNTWTCIISEFIVGISQFSVKGDKESKLRCKYVVIVCVTL